MPKEKRPLTKKTNVRTVRIRLATYTDVNMLKMKYKFCMGKLRGQDLVVGNIITIRVNMTELGDARRMFGKNCEEVR
ncbi:hypothetical protein ES703_44197 [subsurface metagenome]